MPHSLIWKAFDYFRVPVVVVNLIRAYFKDIRLCLSTAGFTTGWQRLEIDIVAGCTISPLAFTMAIHPLSTASPGVGSRGQQLEQRNPDVPVHFLQLFRGDPEAFPGQPRDIPSPLLLELPSGL